MKQQGQHSRQEDGARVKETAYTYANKCDKFSQNGKQLGAGSK